MSNEVVKHHNDLNTVIMRKWSSEEMNFFFAIITKVRDEGTRLMKFDTDELRNLASKDFHLERWSQTMKSVADKVVDLKYYERTEHSYAVMNLFSYFRVDEKERIVEVEVSSKFEYVINKLEAQFTQYELAEFTNIRSTYAKTAYRLLKQWRTVGRKEFKIDEFKTLLDMPAGYKSSEIDRAVVKPILKQLSPYFENLKVKKVKSNKRGNPVLGYEFTWQKEVTGSYDPNKYDKPKAVAKKSSKKATKKSNVPNWSNPDYKNETTEEQKAELERKKQELLARMDKSSEPDVVPGQTDIYDFLGKE
ncbi:replication protein [Streptococcus pneumoniae]|jgi:plasmid replication initiation protein|nr:replication protein [Streptococcus pneumoniae]